ncbi:MAG: trimethylamine methyltransferase family protein [Actinobacteria bacterium]|nr:trimethylamine methyltransferase family protein [Actinomycetota bacterium]
MNLNLQVLEDKDLEKIHDLSIKVLQEPGMKIMNEKMLDALSKKGARVDSGRQVVSFTPEIIDETIEIIRDDYREGRIPKYLNGVTSEKTKNPDIQAKFGGACVQYFDWNEKKFRDPTELDLIDMIRLGEALPEVKTVGNPVVYLRDKNGNPIDPPMQRVKTAALVVKYTTKSGPTEVWNADELEFLIELGTIAKRSREGYFKNPCFITAKETIAPLVLDDKSAEVLLALAGKDLPCTIIPMPISGVSSPVNLYSASIIGNAEILAAAAGIKAVYPGAKVIGGIISGSMDMATGTANFATPEATLQDLGIAEVHERLYGFNFGVGGYLDAKYPGVQNAIEKEFKYILLALTGRFTYPVGLTNWGKCFSPGQAMIDIQIIKNIHKFLEGMVIEDEEEVLSLIRKVGIAGSFLQEEHTLLNYKKYLMVPELFDHSLSSGYENDLKKDMLLKANEKVVKILSRADLYEIDKDRANQIDMIVERAQKSLTGEK